MIFVDFVFKVFSWLYNLVMRILKFIAGCFTDIVETILDLLSD